MYESGGEFVQPRTSKVMNITRRNVLGGLLNRDSLLACMGSVRWRAGHQGRYSLGCLVCSIGCLMVCTEIS